MKEGEAVWKREEQDAWKRASAVNDIDGVLYSEEGTALDVVVGALLEEKEVTGGCAGET